MIHTKDLKGLKLFGQDYPEAKRFIFYGSAKKIYIEGIEVIPIKEALMHLDKLISAF